MCVKSYLAHIFVLVSLDIGHNYKLINDTFIKNKGINDKGIKDKGINNIGIKDTFIIDEEIIYKFFLKIFGGY